MTMGKIMDAIERVVFGASAAETVELRVRLAEQRVMQRMVAALTTDEACKCAACDGEGFTVVDGGPAEAPCVVCGGTGIGEGSAGDGE